MEAILITPTPRSWKLRTLNKDDDDDDYCYNLMFIVININVVIIVVTDYFLVTIQYTVHRKKNSSCYSNVPSSKHKPFL